MVSLQTKLVITFLGSTLLAVTLWDYGSKDEVIEYRRIRIPLTDKERVLHRSKRQLVGNQLHIVYKQFESLQTCCAVPALMPGDALETCQPVKQGQKRRLNGWFNNVQRFYMPPVSTPQVAKQTPLKTRGKRQTAEKIALSSLCYTDCAFSYLSFLNNTALDLVSIEDTFVTKMHSQEWKQIVQDALYTCEEPSACATPSEINLNNKYCSVKPTILMNCMRKQMILNCPSTSRSKDYKCNSGMNALRSINVMSLG